MNRRELLTGAAAILAADQANAFGVGELGTGLGHGGALGRAVTVNNGLALTPRGAYSVPNVNVGYQAALNWERTQAWTCITYVKIAQQPTAGNVEIIFSTCSALVNFKGYEFWINDQGQLQTRIISNYSSNYLGVLGNTNICDGTWHQVAMSYDGSSTAAGVKIYVDGVLEAMTTEAATLSQSILNTHSFLIGNQGSWPYSLGGSLKEFTLSNVVRSQAYIQAYTTAANGDANTKLAYRFNENAGNTATDLSASGFTGYIHSGTWPSAAAANTPAPARVHGVVSADPAASASATITATLSPVASGNMVCGCVVVASVQSLTITDDKGNSYTIADDNTSFSGIRFVTFYALNITNAPTVITATLASGTGTYWRMIAEEFSNVQAAQALDAHACQYVISATGANGATTGNVTTVYGGDLIWCGAINYGAVNMTPGTGFTAGISSFPAQSPMWSEYQIQPYAVAIAGTFTPASTANTHVGMLCFTAK